MPLYSLHKAPWAKHQHILNVWDVQASKYVAAIRAKRCDSYAVYIPASQAELQEGKPMRILIGETETLHAAVKLAAHNKLSWYEPTKE
jgi:hypothetical protein